jgi:hypothetical protein
VPTDYSFDPHSAAFKALAPLGVHPVPEKRPRKPLSAQPARSATAHELRLHLITTGLTEEKLVNADAWLRENPSASAQAYLDCLIADMDNQRLSIGTVLRAGKWIFGDHWRLEDATIESIDGDLEREKADNRRLREQLANLEAENLRLKRNQ